MADIEDVPFVAFADRELGKLLGSVIDCPYCDEQHEIKTNGPLQSYKCPERKNSILLGINGKALPTRPVLPEQSLEQLEQQTILAGIVSIIDEVYDNLTRSSASMQQQSAAANDYMSALLLQQRVAGAQLIRDALRKRFSDS